MDLNALGSSVQWTSKQMKISIPSFFTRFFSFCLIYCLVIIYPAHASTDLESRMAARNWQVVKGYNPVTHKQGCYMRSADAAVRIQDDETRLYLLLTGANLYIVTNSIIDTSYSNTRINVDKYEPIVIEQFTDKKTALIATFDPEYLAQFIKGYWASVHMGFWPSWEKSGLQEARFDLVGFTKTYTEYIQCQAKSEIALYVGE